MAKTVHAPRELTISTALDIVAATYRAGLSDDTLGAAERIARSEGATLDEIHRAAAVGTRGGSRA
jgi:hypothetical protein